VHSSTKGSGQDDSVKGFENLENFLYRYLNEKYGVEDIAMAVAHSLLTATDSLRGENTTVQLWAMSISGEIDDAAWRYWIQGKRLLMKHCSSNGITSSVPQNAISPLIAALYPSPLEHAAVGFTTRVEALAKGPIVLDHIFECLAKHLISKEEDRFRTLEQFLQKKDASNEQALSFHAFSDVIVELAPIPRIVTSPNKCIRIK